MRRKLLEIHAHLRASRALGGPPVPGNVGNVKKYARFPVVRCTTPSPIDASLGDMLKKRKSRPAHSVAPTFSIVCDLLGHSMSVNGQHRPYPSGGALYPVEAYVFPYCVEGLTKHSYHYRPDIHALEQMFPIEGASSTILSAPVAYPVVIAFTAYWARSHGKYHDFALELALMETGHIMQNIQLVGTALGLATCPMGGFTDANIETLLDIDSSQESVLCTLSIGEPAVVSASTATVE